MGFPFDSLIENVYVKQIKEFGFDEAVKFFVKSTVANMAFRSKYKSLPAIETIEEERKKELWKYAKENFPGKGKEDLIEVVKIIYTASQVLGG